MTLFIASMLESCQAYVLSTGQNVLLWSLLCLPWTHKTEANALRRLSGKGKVVREARLIHEDLSPGMEIPGADADVPAFGIAYSSLIALGR